MLARAADQPHLLAGIGWDAVAVAELQVRMLGPAVVAANQRLQHAQDNIASAREHRAQLWAR